MGKHEKTPDWKKRKIRFAIATLVILLTFTAIVLGICAWYWHWSWDMVLNGINPMKNQYALLVYIGILAFIAILIWLIHMYNDEKEI